MSYCDQMGKDRKCNSIFMWLQIKCLHCGITKSLREFHISYMVPIHDMEGKIISESKLLLNCPECKKDMKLTEISMEIEN